MNFDYQRLYMTAEGRIGRQDFWIGVIVIAVVSVVLAFIFVGLFGPLSFMTRLLQFIVQLALAYPAYNVMAKRFQDRDRPAMFAAIIIGVGILLNLIGLFVGPTMMTGFIGTIIGLVWLAVGIWALVELGILKGTTGQNQYGPDPLGTAM